ncbi:Hypothetical predicted protein [Octopus vulgaris]|uniref:Uncharacterized protein n=1 Tax=Octopus vulgaris TaxID=6645 RepID=A0AA36BGN1_OCTVU|nr:Hypothetical predicted protein [Octopus vulgaris]
MLIPHSKNRAVKEDGSDDDNNDDKDNDNKMDIDIKDDNNIPFVEALEEKRSSENDIGSSENDIGSSENDRIFRE